MLRLLAQLKNLLNEKNMIACAFIIYNSSLIIPFSAGACDRTRRSGASRTSGRSAPPFFGGISGSHGHGETRDGPNLNYE